MVSTDDMAWTYWFHHLMACVDRIRMLLQNIHNHLYTRPYGVPTQTKLWILTTASTSKPVPKIIKNWNVDGNVTLGKLNCRTAVYIVTQFLISHTELQNSCIYCDTVFNITHWITEQQYILCTVFNIKQLNYRTAVYIVTQYLISHNWIAEQQYILWHSI